VLPENASNKAITWYASNPAVAEVSANGVVTAKGAGVCAIFATNHDYPNNWAFGYCNVTVSEGGGNTSFATAIAVSAGEAIPVNVTAANQRRYYSFTPAVSGVYTIQAGNSSHQVDPYGWLYNASQALLAQDDDGAGFAGNFRITYTLAAGQTYYIAAGCYSTGSGSYSFTVTGPASGGTPGDNTSFGGALAVTAGNAVPVSITAANQKRYFAFTATVSGTYIVQSSSSGGVDPYGWLYSASLSLLASNDDSTGLGRDFRMAYTLSAGQTYYIVAGCYSSGTGSYSFTITPPAGGPGETPGDNTSFAGAIAVTVGSPVAVNVSAAGQNRYYSFTPTASGTYIVQSSSSGGVDPFCWLYSGSRTLLAYNDDAPGLGRNFKITYTLVAGQTYYIGACCYSSGTGSYTFTITRQ
jgi:hypothetical protein